MMTFQNLDGSTVDLLQFMAFVPDLTAQR